MAKAASPVRLQHSLMSAAVTAGAIMHRSAAEQVEYWADIGRKVSGVVNPEVLLAIHAGLATLRVERSTPSPVDPDAVFTSLNRARASGAISEAIASGGVRYQASVSRPGYLEACHPDGRTEVGRFLNGRFIPE